MQKLATRRNRNKVIDFQITKNRDFSSYLIMARRVESKYNINYLCADGVSAKIKGARELRKKWARESLAQSWVIV